MHARIIAHRGASADAPENTLAAFSLARERGAHAVELDVQLCGSGEVVVFHDDTLERLTGAVGRVADTPLQTLRLLRVRGETIPTFEEVLAAKDRRPPGLVVEVKAEGTLPPPGLEEKVVALLRRYCPGPPSPPHLVVSSFQPIVLRRLRRLAPSIPRGLLLERRRLALRERLFPPLARPWELHLEAAAATPARIARAHAHGLAVIAWTVNDPAEGARLLASGVSGLITDRPELFAR